MDAGGTHGCVNSTSHPAVASWLRVLHRGVVAFGSAIHPPGPAAEIRRQHRVFLVLGSTGRGPDAPSTVPPAARILAAMVGDLISATTRPTAARGAARPHAVSESPAADPTRTGRAQARQRPAIVRPEIPHRSRPPPRRRVISFACRPAMPCARAYVWRERLVPHASHPVHRRRFERRPSPSHPGTPISWGAHRPTLVPGPFLLQISTPMD